MAHLFLLATPTPTPTQPPAEVVENAVRVIDTFESLGPLMALMGVVTLVLLLALLITWVNRNSNSTVASALTKLAEDRANEAKEANKERREELQAISEAVKATAANGEKQTALLERMDKRSEERAMVEAAQAASLDTLVNQGSKPLRDLIQQVATVMGKVDALDTKQNSSLEIMAQIPTLRAEVNAKFDAIMTELLKRSTKPIPAVEMPAEGSPT